MKKSQKKVENLKKKKKAEIFGMPSACDNTVISLDPLSVSIFHHLQPYFQCWLVQNNFKSETNIKYTKLKKARDNNWKSVS